MTKDQDSDDERTSEAIDTQILKAQQDYLHFSHRNPMASQWDTAFRQLYRLFKIFEQYSVQVLHNQRGFEISCDHV